MLSCLLWSIWLLWTFDLHVLYANGVRQRFWHIRVVMLRNRMRDHIDRPIATYCCAVDSFVWLGTVCFSPHVYRIMILLLISNTRYITVCFSLLYSSTPESRVIGACLVGLALCPRAITGEHVHSNSDHSQMWCVDIIVEWRMNFWARSGSPRWSFNSGYSTLECC